jgi:Capsular polysaccharide synthesis protein/Tetratricopeptide repeat
VFPAFRRRARLAARQLAPYARGLAARFARAGWPRLAVRAHRLALACDDRRAAWWIALAHAQERAGRWDAAVDAYAAAVARRPRKLKPRLALARALERTGRWEEAVEHLATAAANPRAGRRELKLYRRAQRRAERWAAVRRGEPPEVAIDEAGDRRADVRARERQASRAAARLARDRHATALDQRLLQASPDRLAARRRMLGFLSRHLPEIQAAAAESPATPDPRAGRQVYVFWAQGIQDAPPLVRLCARHARHHHGERVTFLDGPALRQRLELPPEVARSIGADWTKLSDLLRLELLRRHGGIWLDATCLTCAPLPDVLPRNGFFAFTIRPGRPASWLLAAAPGHHIIATMCAAQHVYWAHHERARDYFLFHHMFEALTLLDERFGALWSETPTIGRRDAQAFQRAMLDPYEPERFRALLGGSAVHKLSWKYGPGAIAQDTMLARLLSDGPPRAAGLPQAQLRWGLD